VLAPLTACAAFAPLGALKVAVLDGHWQGLVTLFPVSLLPFLFGVFALAFVLGPFVRPKLTIGTDGVLVEHWGRREFFPHATTQVTSEGPAIVLSCEDGRRQIRTTGFDEASTIMRRIEEARSGGGIAPANGVEALERRGRAVSEWRAAIRAKLGDESGYREGAPLVTRDLVELVENPSAPLETRLAAALGVGAGEDLEARRRVRVASETCAHPRVRIALEEAADGEPNDRSVDKAMQAVAQAGIDKRSR
jgi:hypothetical protein